MKSHNQGGKVAGATNKQVPIMRDNDVLEYQITDTQQTGSLLVPLRMRFGGINNYSGTRETSPWPLLGS
jgi:hypothetical protein